MNCSKFYINQTGMKVSAQKHQHNLAARICDPLPVCHEDQDSLLLDLDEVKILG